MLEDPYWSKELTIDEIRERFEPIPCPKREEYIDSPKNRWAQDVPGELYMTKTKTDREIERLKTLNV